MTPDILEVFVGPSWIVNAGPDDEPPFTVWHTGGPGGQIGQFDNYEDACACVWAFNTAQHVLVLLGWVEGR